MGREVRMVPPDWVHPYDFNEGVRAGVRGSLISLRPLFRGDFAHALAEWEEERRHWDAGEVRCYSKDGARWKAKDADVDCSADDWHGTRPDPATYMPEFAPGTATHLQMYETTSEGTPISPVFDTPEKLARWLTDNGASAFGDSTASYEGWLRVARGGYAPSMVIGGGVMASGVDMDAVIPPAKDA